MATEILQSELIQELKLIANDLGTVPTRNLYAVYAKRPYAYQNVFGTFKAFLKAAGIDPETTLASKSQRVKSKSDTDVKARVKKFYSGNLEKLLNMPQHDVNMKIGPFPKILCVPDLHFPFAHMPSLKLVYELISQLQPAYIIQLGDLYDYYAFSKFPRSHYVISPEEEILKGRELAVKFWEEVIKVSPKADHYQILGNHDIRPHRRLLESSCPELEYFFDFRGLFEFDGVTTIHDTRTPLVINSYESNEPITFTHGHLSGNGKHRIKFGTHVVHGHTHAGEYILNKIPGTDKTLFELSCGYLGDISTKVFNYCPVKEMKWTRGVGYIDTYGGHFIPFE